MRTSSGDVAQIVDLSGEEPEVIHVDKCILEVLLVNIVKANPDAHELVVKLYPQSVSRPAEDG